MPRAPRLDPWPLEAGALLRVPVRVGGFVAITAALLGIAEAHQALVDAARREAVFDAYRRRWCRAWLRLMGAELRVALPPPPHNGRGRLVVANHRAFFDIPILLGQIGGAFLSRADLAAWPLFGRAARKAGTIFVERGEKKSGNAAIWTMRERLSQGGTVLVFPEGTTYAGDELRPFRAGGFVAARGLDADIVPVGLAYGAEGEMGEESTLRHVGKTAVRARTPVAVSFGKPLGVSDDVEAMIHATRSEVANLIRHSRQVLGGPSR